MTTACKPIVAALPLVGSIPLLDCGGCGRPAEHGWSRHGRFFWIGCAKCGRYTSAYTTFVLLTRWKEINKQSNGDMSRRDPR